MKLLCVTDLHGKRSCLERILRVASPVDAVLLGGDITNFGSPIDAQRIVEVAKQSATTVLAVAGNCDSAEIDQQLAEWGVSVSGRGVVLDSIGIHGVSGIPPWKRGMYQLSEDDLARTLEAGYAQLGDGPSHVVLAHVPPHGLAVDRTFLWKHAGSEALRTFVERTQPALVFCGHIHEGRGVDHLGTTTVVNCGEGASGSFAVAEIDSELRVELRQA